MTMGEVITASAGVAIAVAGFALLVLGLVFALMSDREGQLVDDPPTLDTRNHLDD